VGAGIKAWKAGDRCWGFTHQRASQAEFVFVPANQRCTWVRAVTDLLATPSRVAQYLAACLDIRNRRFSLCGLARIRIQLPMSGRPAIQRRRASPRPIRRMGLPGRVPDAPPSEADQAQTRCTASCGAPVRSDRPVARRRRADLQKWAVWCMTRARSELRDLITLRHSGTGLYRKDATQRHH
jgi:hypothetical protein